MKKIIMSAIVAPNDQDVTLENLKDALRHLGTACFAFGAEVELADIKGLTKEVWLYVSSDDSEPHIQVAGRGEMVGIALSVDEVDQLKENGVCTEFHAEYPRADRYGAPAYASGDDFAAGVVGNHGFSVSADGLTVHAKDRRDDGAEEIWLKILSPE